MADKPFDSIDRPAALTLRLRLAERAGFEVREWESLREHGALALRHWVRRREVQGEPAPARWR